MEWNWQVFLIASAVSYGPLYWLLERLVRRWPLGQPTQVPRPRDTRSQFLAFLRREATARADAALSDVLAELMRRRHGATPDIPPLDRKTLSRLRDTRRMLTTLFPADIIAAFDLVLSTVEHARPLRTKEAYENILAFKSKLTHSLGHDSRAWKVTSASSKRFSNILIAWFAWAP